MFNIDKLNTDFVAASNGVDSRIVQDSIWSNANIATLFLGLMTNNDGVNLTFVFDSEPSEAEKTELNVIIAAHTGKSAPLSELQKEIAHSKIEIDDYAGDARARYITVSPGQSAVYIEKEKQSKAFKDAGYPTDETGYEFVTAEKNANGVTAIVAAETVLAMAGGWKLIAANIEEARISYKNQVTSAVDKNTAVALRNKARAILGAF